MHRVPDPISKFVNQVKKGLILFVDDEYYIVQTLKSIFRRAFFDYKIEYVLSGEEALKLLEASPESALDHLVVFSDWLMPGIKGDDLLIEIHRKYPHSIGFLLSGMIDKEPNPDAFETGAIKKVIQKPWDNQNLIDELNLILK
jgi:response regulator RpfG family c-di-GMP phosphodiesterase